MNKFHVSIYYILFANSNLRFITRYFYLCRRVWRRLRTRGKKRKNHFNGKSKKTQSLLVMGAQATVNFFAECAIGGMRKKINFIVC